MQQISKNCYKGRKLGAAGLLAAQFNGQAVWSDRMKMKAAAFICSMQFRIVMNLLKEGLYEVVKK